MEKLTLSLAAAVFFTAVVVFAENGEENLLPIVPRQFASWVKTPKAAFDVPGGVDLTKDAKGAAAVRALVSDFFPAYVAAEKVRLSFRYRGGCERMYVNANWTLQERPKKGVQTYFEKSFEASADWRDFSCEIPVPTSDFWHPSCKVVMAAGGGKLEVRELRIEECAPERTGGKPFTVNGAAIEEIDLLETADVARHLEELRAARMFRYMLYKNGGVYLPVRTLKDVAQAGKKAVLIGAAAVKAGLATASDEARHQGFDGGFVARAKGTQLGIVGCYPSGLTFGVFRVFSALGLEYLGGTCWRRPKTDAFVFAGDQEVTPAIAFRGASVHHGTMPELRGRYRYERLVGDYSLGQVVEGMRLAYHTWPFSILSPGEIAQTHPEFMALQADGKRFDAKTNPMVAQYCLSNPELATFAAERLKELMRLDPVGRIWGIQPGDGYQKDCHCENCRAFGSPSDAFADFANRVAEITAKEFPDRYIGISSYVDTPERPKRPIKMHPNVIGEYCPYPSRYWPSQMVWEHPINVRGKKALEGWREVLPRIGLCYYPMQCGETLNFWPGYYCDVQAVRDFARHRAVRSYYFGLYPAFGEANAQAGAFADLRIHVLGRLEVDPETDDLPLARQFIRDFYSHAAEPMQRYFDVIEPEAQRRGWIQTCEQHTRGFVTPELAAKALIELDAAEKLAEDEDVLFRVQHEKLIFLWSYLSDVSRGRGNVPWKDFPAWAKRVGEFCRLCRDTKVANMGNVKYNPPSDWFQRLAFFKVKDSKNEWYKDPKIQAIIENPEKELGGEFPNYQEVVNGSIVIPMKGTAGASGKKEIRSIRRPTSGYGTLFTELRLEKAPEGPVKLYATGNESEHPEIADMELVVNGTCVYRGKVPFKKVKFTEQAFDIPAGLLVKGRNEIRFKNTTPDAEASEDGITGDAFIAKRNYFWGWYQLSQIRFPQ